SIVAGEWVPKINKGIRNALTVLGFTLLGYSGIIALVDVTGMPIQIGPLLTIVCGLLVVAGGVLWHIKTDALTITTHKAEMEISSRPTLEATNDSTINAAGAEIP